MDSVTRKVFKLRLYRPGMGLGLCPTDVPELLLKFVYSPLNLLRYFKDGVHRSKIDIILDPDSIKASGSDFNY